MSDMFDVASEQKRYENAAEKVENLLPGGVVSEKYRHLALELISTRENFRFWTTTMNAGENNVRVLQMSDEEKKAMLGVKPIGLVGHIGRTHVSEEEVNELALLLYLGRDALGAFVADR